MPNVCQISSVILGDTTRSSSYETTSGANVASYTVGQVTNTNHVDLRKSNINFGKSDGEFETTVQRSFGSHTADEVRNAHVNTTSATKMRTEIDSNNKQKAIMVSSSHAATSNVGALYDVKLQKREGTDMRRTNFSFGTQKQQLASETGTTFKKHGAVVYTAPVQKQEVSWNAFSGTFAVVPLICDYDFDISVRFKSNVGY